MRRALLATALVLVPTLAFAHPGLPGHTHGFADGVLHPLTGIDHILAMVAVGLFAAQLGGRALWLVPASFVAVMAAAGVAGMNGVTLPMTEAGIALSIVALGAVIALRISMPVAAAMTMVGFFAVFHGYAHGAEAPDNVSGFLYGMGFVAATAMLHAAGIGIGLALGRIRGTAGRTVMRVAGSLAAVIGVAMLTGAV
jgi:urease accessory protein